MSSPHASFDLRAIAEFQSYLMKQGNGKSSAWPTAQRRIQHVAERLREAQPDGPFDCTKVANLLSVTVRAHSYRNGKQLGQLVPVKGGFEATVYGVSSPGASMDSEHTIFQLARDRRARFTIAHELGHTLFYKCGDKDQIPCRLLPRGAPTSREYRREEGLCHDFARALLVPSSHRHRVPERASTAFLLREAAALRVGLQPLARRILHDWQLWADAIIVMIVLDEQGPRVTVLRGKQARPKTDLTAPLIQSALATVRQDPQNALRLLVGEHLLDLHGTRRWCVAAVSASRGRRAREIPQGQRLGNA